MSMDEQSQTLTPPSAANAEALWRQANDLAAQGNLLGAVPLYLEVSDLWPDSPTVWLNLGIVLGALDRHEEALQCLLRAQGLDRNDPHIHYQLGQMHGQLGQLEAAAESFLAAAASDPGYVDAWLGLADLSLQCRETELAQQYLNEVFLIIPDHPSGSFCAG